MNEFLAENNACGQNLLLIVSHGHSIIAEILRLKDYIPDIYRLETKADQLKYAELILDFSYLKIAEAQEKKIEESPELQELDAELHNNYLELLSRFYTVFECSHQYAKNLELYIDELQNGYYIQETLESVLQDEEGKQLMCEALYLFGVILLLIDYHIPGVIRERLLISYYRYSSDKTNHDSSIDDVCMLLRSTGYDTTTASNGKTQPPTTILNYPEYYFARFHFDEKFVAMVIGRLRCDDIYNQLSIYPHPDHRATALSTQAGMLFVCLFFCPKILHSQVAQMREIVDKFFADNWVVSIYMGLTVNLIDAWFSFRAAKAALMPVVESKAVRALSQQQRKQMKKTLRKTQNTLLDGYLTDYYVLQNINKIIDLIRQCNVLLRWYFIHALPAVYELSGSARKITNEVRLVVQEELMYKTGQLFELLATTSELELLVKEILRKLMEEKGQRWDLCQKEAYERITELSEAFAGTQRLSRIEQNKQLQKWFKEIGLEIMKLSIETPNTSGRTLIQMVQALEDVQEYHNLEASMQVKQYLIETREYLNKMIQIINIKEQLLINIQLIGDLSYAWLLLDRDFTSYMQDCIKSDPKHLIRLRAIFLKLSSALEIPLLRINQSKSEDLESVSRYYSHDLANCMRKVLQIIPETMFSILARIIHLQTGALKELPTRMDKDKNRDFSQLEDRLALGKLTYDIAVFTEGVLMMKRTLVGVIELNPKELLEDGIRKELVKNLANAFNLGLIFSARQPNISTPSATVVEFEYKLINLTKTMDGYRRSFEYIQDYLKVHGVKLLQEELTRLISYNVEKECNALLGNKLQDWQSKYQSQTIPIPSFPPLANDCTKSNNFIGRVARELLYCTDPKQTLFLDLKATWYERRPPHKEVLDARFFMRIREAICPAGMVGLSRLYSYMLADDLKRNLEKLQKNLSSDKQWSDTLQALCNELEAKTFPNATVRAHPLKFYMSYHTRWLKVWPTITDWLLALGHMQLLRQQLAYELKRSSKSHSKNLESALEAFNCALLADYAGKNYEIKNENDRRLVAQLTTYLKYTGSFEPLEEVFCFTKNHHNLPLFMFLYTIAHLPRLQFSLKTQTLLPKTPKEHLDGTTLIVGLLTVFQQFHKNIRLLYISYLCQFVKIMVETNLSTKQELGNDAITTLHFLETFIRMARLPRSILTERIPTIIMNQFEYLAASTSQKN